MTVEEQKVELRIGLEQGGRFGLAWQATLGGDHLFAGARANDGREVFRFTYHRDGKNHFYVEGNRTITEPHPELVAISGVQQIATWHPPGLPEFNYRPKPDSDTRRTLIVPYPARPTTVDLWALEAGDPADAFQAVFAGPGYFYERDHRRGFIEVAGAVAAGWTTPRLVAVIWWMTLEALENYARQVPPERLATTPQGPGMVINRKFYGCDSEKGLTSFDFSTMPKPDLKPGEVKFCSPEKPKEPGDKR
jgi:hypothetical protein